MWTGSAKVSASTPSRRAAAASTSASVAAMTANLLRVRAQVVGCGKDLPLVRTACPQGYGLARLPRGLGEGNLGRSQMAPAFGKRINARGMASESERTQGTLQREHGEHEGA